MVCFTCGGGGGDRVDVKVSSKNNPYIDNGEIRKSGSILSNLGAKVICWWFKFVSQLPFLDATVYFVWAFSDKSNKSKEEYNQVSFIHFDDAKTKSSSYHHLP